MAWTKCKTVTVTVKGDVAKVLNQVKKEAKGNDIEISGNEKSGTLRHKSVDVKGTYTVNGNKIDISMMEDSMWVSCERIENGIRDWFKGK